MFALWRCCGRKQPVCEAAMSGEGVECEILRGESLCRIKFCSQHHFDLLYIRTIFKVNNFHFSRCDTVTSASRLTETWRSVETRFFLGLNTLTCQGKSDGGSSRGDGGRRRKKTSDLRSPHESLLLRLHTVWTSKRLFTVDVFELQQRPGPGR